MSAGMVAAWWVAVSLLVACVEWVVFHWPVRKQMAVEDWLVRGGLLLMMLDLAITALFVALEASAGVVQWTALPALCVASGCVVGGFAILLRKYRHQRSTAGLQPHVGVPPEEI